MVCEVSIHAVELGGLFCVLVVSNVSCVPYSTLLGFFGVACLVNLRCCFFPFIFVCLGEGGIISFPLLLFSESVELVLKVVSFLKSSSLELEVLE